MGTLTNQLQQAMALAKNLRACPSISDSHQLISVLSYALDEANELEDTTPAVPVFKAPEPARVIELENILEQTIQVHACGVMCGCIDGEPKRMIPGTVAVGSVWRSKEANEWTVHVYKLGATCVYYESWSSPEARWSTLVSGGGHTPYENWGNLFELVDVGHHPKRCRDRFAPGSGCCPGCPYET